MALVAPAAVAERSRSVEAVVSAVRSRAWLRSPSFDLGFIIGITALGVAGGVTAVSRPDWFPWIVAADVWLLGQIHIASTFTRLGRHDPGGRRWLVTRAPFVIFAACGLLALSVGAWILATTYLYWQWWHYTRQSFGIARAYARKAGSAAVPMPQWAFHLVPVWGIVHRSYQSPDTYLGMSLRVVPVAGVVVDAAAAVAIAVTAWWVVRQSIRSTREEGGLPYALFVTSHIVIFLTGYVLIDDINHGWLAINLWHNVQYIAFVWLQNNRRFSYGVEPAHKLLSTLSQPPYIAPYLLFCLGVALTLTLGLLSISAFFGSLTLPLVLVVSQTINFHHYLADTFIWKTPRKAPLQAALSAG